MTSKELRQQIIFYWLDGSSLVQIALYADISHRRVWAILKRAGYKVRHRRCPGIPLRYVRGPYKSLVRFPRYSGA
jgi:DNA-binding CsgD family transcriptional regulator